MIKGIISITGKPGLYKLVSRGKNSLIVESLQTAKRMPTYPHEKVISLADITMYSDNGDVPLPDVFQKIYDLTEGKPVEGKRIHRENDMRDFFAKILPDFDRERVHNSDLQKLFSWYNQLIASGVTEFKDNELAEDRSAEAAEKADETETK